MVVLAATVFFANFAVFAKAKAPVTPADLVGVWQYVQSGILGHGVIYTEFQKNGDCLQIFHASALWQDKWGYIDCTWQLTGNDVRLAVNKSSTSSAKKGDNIDFNLAKITKKYLILMSGSKKQKWERVPEIPTQFRAKYHELRLKH
ncbi:MAG TPA: hypothetical protein VFK96_09240 [Gammaproteobacteria bacterium]|nr:hypothetical protein [Gammaproteobacteria bacterium]